MMAVKKRDRPRRRTHISITTKRRSDMVDILVKANTDLNTQENVR